MTSNSEKRTVTFEIRQHIGVLNRRSSGWTREFNLVCWNGKEPPKYDVRDWNEDHTRMSKGLTLFADEMEKLCGLYNACQTNGIAAEDLGGRNGSAGSGSFTVTDRPATPRMVNADEEQLASQDPEDAAEDGSSGGRSAVAEGDSELDEFLAVDADGVLVSDQSAAGSGAEESMPF